MLSLTTAEVLEKKPLTPYVRHVALRVLDAPALTFRPGQFIQFVLDPRTLRQFSLASLPAALPVIELCVDISPMGRGSRFIEGLHHGNRVTFHGPFGVFAVSFAETRPLEFVATGAGIAPIRAMIADVLQRPAVPPVVLTFGNRTADDILYHAEWRALAAQQPAFQYRPTLSQPPADWEGFGGRVTEVLAARTDLVGHAFYICGSPEMVDDVRNVLETAGVPQADVRFEKFF